MLGDCGADDSGLITRGGYHRLCRKRKRIKREAPGFDVVIIEKASGRARESEPCLPTDQGGKVNTRREHRAGRALRYNSLGGINPKFIRGAVVFNPNGVTLPVFEIPTRCEGRQMGHHIAIAQDADVIRIWVARSLVVIDLHRHALANSVIAKATPDKPQRCSTVSLDHEGQSIRAVGAAVNVENPPGVHGRVRPNGERARKERGSDLIRQIRSQPQHPSDDCGIAVQCQTTRTGETREILTECLRLDGPGKILEIRAVAVAQRDSH